MIRNILITVYVLVILSISATSRAANDIMPIFVDHETVQTQTYEGEVVFSVDGDAYLILEDSRYFRLAANIELNDFNGL